MLNLNNNLLSSTYSNTTTGAEKFKQTVKNATVMLENISKALKKGEEPPLVINSPDRENSFPRHFRQGSDALVRMGAHKNSDIELPNSDTLKCLRISASAQPSEGEFKFLKEKIKNVTIVNLREENSFFINGTAISVFAATNLGNMHKPLSQILAEEDELITRLQEMKMASLCKVINKTSLETSSSLAPDSLNERTVIQTPIETICTEEEIVRREGMSYLRLPMTDHMRPKNEVVDDFIQAFRNPENENHLHFHCWEGHGRTTTAMIMLDAMRNATNERFQDICLRQWFLGGEGSDLSHVPPQPNYKHELFDERFEFLKTFYAYCQKNRALGFQQTWSQYINEL